MITRRDFINGVAVGLAGASVTSSWTGCASAPRPIPGADHPSGAAIRKGLSSEAYPPLLQGIRGQHDGSFDVAHQMALGGRSDWGAPTQPDARYELIVVGAGLSGLAAAHFYKKRKPDARVLILDNHDDFGGHARRNEFEVDGRMFLGAGGSQSIVNFGINDAMQELLDDLAVDLDVFEDGAYDNDFYERHGLTQHWFFDKETYGADCVVPMSGPLGLNVPFPKTPPEQSIAQMPLSEAAREELLALHRLSEDRTPASFLGELDYLRTTTYEDLLKKCGVTSPQLLNLLAKGVAHAGFWSDNATAEFALSEGLPGIEGTSLRFLRQNRLGKLARFALNYVHHFPDGNASMARLLVRRLVPNVSDGSTTMSSIVTAPFDYGRLDEQGTAVRIRLNSTAINVAHDGPPSSAKGVAVTYVRENVAEQVHADHVVLACHNRVIPHLCRELPKAQADALRLNFRSPLFYTNVVLRRWHALKKAKIGGAFSPGCLHSTMTIDLPVSIGDYRFSRGTDDAIVLYMGGSTRGSGAPDHRERFKTQRHELLGMPFEQFEADLRRQLTGMLGSYGFDADRDIAGITVNRWSHGYTMSPDLIFDKAHADGEAPHEIGRRTLGRIAIANCDAGAIGLQQASYEQAARAVGELLA